jgi:hypothetical protein
MSRDTTKERLAISAEISKVRRHLTREDGGATYFTHEVSFVGPLASVFGNLLDRRYLVALPMVMESLRKIAES